MTIQRKEVIGGQTLILGDCLKVMPDLSPVDAVVTDPVWPNCPDGLIPGSDRPFELFRLLWASVTTRRACIVMRHDSDPRFLEPVPLPYLRAVFLPYVMPGYIGRFLGGDEIAYCFGEPIPSREGQRVIPGRAPSVQPGGRKANGHPCSRALEHFVFLCRWWSELGETVLDPFMGSATTLVACQKLGRQGIGIEIDPDYFEIACRRVEEAAREPDLLIDQPKPPEPRQEALL